MNTVSRYTCYSYNDVYTVVFIFVVVTARLREIREMAWFDTADQRQSILIDRQHPSYHIYLVVKESWSSTEHRGEWLEKRPLTP